MVRVIGAAAICGALLGLGLWTLVGILPPLRRPRLAERIAPYLLDISAGARDLVTKRAVDPLPVVGSLLAPAVRRGRTILEQVLGRRDVIERRLAQADSPSSVERIRLEQLLMASLGAGASVLMIVLLPTVSAMPAPALLALPVLGAMLGVAARDRALAAQATRRMARLEGELPTVLEFLTLSLSAGEGIHDALRRVSRADGELSREFSRVLADVGVGSNLSTALLRMDERLGLTSVSRLVDQTVSALARGAPLAEVLRAQADDARTLARRRLLDAAGKKEVAMMVPLVFLILPCTILFAVFPGLVVFQQGF
ncbi:type II secretion system F family protein [Microbacteriaceae bacterium VKM Ac-2855]|nr:type II secretion system F family protein [Microbacteriaceae bacterium VKM Ac-2855]